MRVDDDDDGWEAKWVGTSSKAKGEPREAIEAGDEWDEKNTPHMDGTLSVSLCACLSLCFGSSDITQRVTPSQSGINFS